MELLAKKLLEHFNVRGGTVITTKATIKSFLKKIGGIKQDKSGSTTTDTAIMNKVYLYCEKLKSSGLLLDFGNNTREPILNNHYINLGYDQALANYGGYDFFIEGFIFIHEAFSDSVIPVDIKDSEKRPDIGTCFVIGPNLFVTARHCIENQYQIKICTKDGIHVVPDVIGVYKDNDIDICIVKTEGEPFNNLMYFDLSDPKTLLEVLTMGYPPIPGFEAIQISDLANIGATLKNSKGNIVGSGKSYLDKLDYFLINAKVKSGNSGSPVIDKYGRVVGIVTNIPLDSKDKEKLDGLGYGIAISSQMISRLLHQMEYGSNFDKISFKISEDASFSTIA